MVGIEGRIIGGIAAANQIPRVANGMLGFFLLYLALEFAKHIFQLLGFIPRLLTHDFPEFLAISGHGITHSPF
jgi:hypothetical protein